MSSSPALSLVVPCLDEARRIAPCLEAIADWHAARAEPWGSLEVIVVDDGSVDETAAAARAAAAPSLALRVVPSDPRCPGRNRGKGQALRMGVAAARGRVIAFLDADLAVAPTSLDGLLHAIEGGADVVLGSRALDQSDVARAQGTSRRWLGKMYLRFARRWLGLDVSDVTCGFKAFRASVAKALFRASRTDRWGIDAEILYLAERGLHAIAEVPVRWVDGGQSRVRLARDVVGSLGSLFAVRWRHGRRGSQGATTTAPATTASGR